MMLKVLSTAIPILSTLNWISTFTNGAEVEK